MKNNKYLIALAVQSVLVLSVSSFAFAGDIEVQLPAASDAFTVDQPAGTELMRVNGDGNVGIGTDAPSDGSGSGGQALKLDVEGAVGASHYCDENGENCQIAASLGAGGGGLPTCTDGQTISYNTSSSVWECADVSTTPESCILSKFEKSMSGSTQTAVSQNESITLTEPGQLILSGYMSGLINDTGIVLSVDGTVVARDIDKQYNDQTNLTIGNSASAVVSLGAGDHTIVLQALGSSPAGSGYESRLSWIVMAEDCAAAGTGGNATPADFEVKYVDTTEAAGGGTVSPASATWVSNVTDTTMSPAGVVTIGAADAGFWTCSANGKTDDATAASGWAAVYLLVNGSDFHGNISQVESGSFNYESTAWSGRLAAGDTLEVRINSSYGDDWVGIEMACAKSGVVTTTSGAVTVDLDPASNLTGNAEGDVAYDATDKELQVFDGASWASVGGGSGTKKQYLDTPITIDHINNTGAVTNTQPNFDLSGLTTVPTWATHAIVLGKVIVSQSGGFSGSSNSAQIRLSHNGTEFISFAYAAAYGGSGQADRSDDTNTQEVRIRNGNLIGFESTTSDGGNTGQNIQARLYLVGFAGYQ